MAELVQDMIDVNAFETAKITLHHKFSQILDYYFEDTESYIATIRTGIETKDAGLITPAAHTIKSSSRQMGGIILSSLAAEIEELARHYLKEETEFDLIVKKSEKLEEIFLKTKEQMQEIGQ